MSIDRYRRKQLAKRDGGAVPKRVSDPAQTAGAGSGSGSGATIATETPSADPSDPRVLARDER